jgi:hypothetical protein
VKLQAASCPQTREKVEIFKFLGVHITDKLKWTTHTDSVVKKAQQSLFNLRRLMKCGLLPKTLTDFYRCAIESILLGCITACTATATTRRSREWCSLPPWVQALTQIGQQRRERGDGGTDAPAEGYPDGLPSR